MRIISFVGLGAMVLCSELAAQESRPATVESLAGCYTLNLGPWQDPSNLGVRDYNLLPSVFRLDTTGVSTTRPGNRRVAFIPPSSPARTSTPTASWSFTSPLPLRITWSAPQVSVSLLLNVREDGLVGTTQTFTDFLGGPPRPSAAAYATKAPCPAELIPNVSIPATDAEIYSVVLDSLFPRAVHKAAKVLVVLDTSSSFRREGLVAEFWDALYRIRGSDTALVQAFERRARDGLSLYTKPDTIASNTGWRVQYTSRAVLSSIPRVATPRNGRPGNPTDAYWEGFYKLFPESVGSIALSPIGYSQDGNRAIVLTDHGCGGLCGEGHIVTLRRENGRWQIVAMEMTWVS